MRSAPGGGCMELGTQTFLLLGFFFLGVFPYFLSFLADVDEAACCAGS